MPTSYSPSRQNSTFTTTRRSLPPGPGPLDTRGNPLCGGSHTLPSRYTGAGNTVTYETTTPLNDSLRYDRSMKSSTISSSYGGTYTTSRRVSSLDKTSSADRYSEKRYSSISSPVRRLSVSDRISQIDSRESETSYAYKSPYSDHKSSIDVNTPPKDTKGLTGLRNLRNTCFMNCILQCTSNTKPLLEYCLNDDFQYDINDKLSPMKGQLIRAYAALMKEMWKPNGENCVSPTAFKSSIARFAPRFVGYSQQDSQEFLRYLLQGLHEDVNRVTTRPRLPVVSEEEDDNMSDKPKFYWDRYLKLERSIIVDIFVGQLRSSLTCTHCSYESTTFDPFWDLSLPIPKYSSSIKLQDCIKLFTAEEVLDGDEKPTCARCKTRRKCTKRFSIQRFPRVLVLHLKRFSGDRFRSKLTTLVNFPLNDLDMSPFAADSEESSCRRYNLTGVSNHSGTVFSGHYTAYCRHPYRDDWHEYNDQSVRSIPIRNIVSSEAYVLFYELADKKSRL